VANAADVAAAILERSGPMSTMKLQKLLYYCQAWHLVWEDEPLFPERIEAWVNGPVVPEIYHAHKGNFSVSKWTNGNSSSLTQGECSTIDAVLEFYGSRTAQWLSQVSHQESPWKDARDGLAPGARGSQIISHEAMQGYYAGLPPVDGQE